MKVHYNRLLSYMYIWGFVLLMVACQDNDNDPANQQPTEPTQPKTGISIVFSPQGLGDHAYNDLILKGALEAQEEGNAEITIYSPNTLDEGKAMIQGWLYWLLNNGSIDAIIIAGNEYEASVREWIATEGNNLPDELFKKMLLFETASTDLPLYTFMINMYGASYIAGSIATLFADSAAVIAANAADLSLKRNIDGFRDGFLDNEGENIVTSYLAQDFNGYSMPQEAYRQTDSLTNLNYRFIYPVAGGSNQGIYRYSREYPDRLYTAGMDVNLSAYSAHITFSTVKRIDQVVKQYINRLCSEGTFGDTLHTTYGIAERYADIDWVEGYEDSYKELINYYYPIVTEKEQEYEQNLAEEGGESHE